MNGRDCSTSDSLFFYLTKALSRDSAARLTAQVQAEAQALLAGLSRLPGVSALASGPTSGGGGRNQVHLDRLFVRIPALGIRRQSKTVHLVSLLAVRWRQSQ